MRPAAGDVEVVQLRDGNAARKPGRDRGVEILALPVLVRVERLHVAAPAIAAALGDHVQVDAAGHHLGGDCRRLIVDLLEHPLVVVQHRRAAATARPVDGGPIDREVLVVVARSVHAQRALLHGLRAADVVGVDLHAGDDLGERPRIAARRHAFENRLVHHRLLQVRLHVDRGRRARHGDRLLQGAHFELQVDGRGEAGADDDVAALDGPESLQLELQRVSARREPIETVGAAAVGHLRGRAAEQAFAAERHRHAWQHAAAGILDDAGDRSRGDLRLAPAAREPETRRQTTTTTGGDGSWSPPPEFRIGT